MPTETQKNTCYALALKTEFSSIEGLSVICRVWAVGAAAVPEVVAEAVAAEAVVPGFVGGSVGGTVVPGVGARVPRSR